MIVSEEFSTAERLARDNVLPLPEEYPEWFNKLVPVCKECAKGAAALI